MSCSTFSDCVLITSFEKGLQMQELDQHFRLFFGPDYLEKLISFHDEKPPIRTELTSLIKVSVPLMQSVYR